MGAKTISSPVDKRRNVGEFLPNLVEETKLLRVLSDGLNAPRATISESAMVG